MNINNSLMAIRTILIDKSNALRHNNVFLAAAIGWAAAQIIKTILNTLVTKKFNAERLLGTGGMPSSHSSTVCALATAVWIYHGPSSTEFAISAILAIIVMYDALGVRRETGKQAVIINEMIKLFEDMGSDISDEEKLKEFVGHTPFQVLMGAILGIVIGCVVCMF